MLYFRTNYFYIISKRCKNSKFLNQSSKFYLLVEIELWKVDYFYKKKIYFLFIEPD